jgi:hypothetical protein
MTAAVPHCPANVMDWRLFSQRLTKGDVARTQHHRRFFIARSKSTLADAAEPESSLDSKTMKNLNYLCQRQSAP